MVNPVEREPIPLTWSSLVRLSAIARAAGRAAMVHYRTEVPVEYKADRSPVTAADHAAPVSAGRATTAHSRGEPVVSSAETGAGRGGRSKARRNRDAVIK